MENRTSYMQIYLSNANSTLNTLNIDVKLLKVYDANHIPVDKTNTLMIEQEVHSWNDLTNYQKYWIIVNGAYALSNGNLRDVSTKIMYEAKNTFDFKDGYIVWQTAKYHKHLHHFQALKNNTDIIVQFAIDNITNNKDWMLFYDNLSHKNELYSLIIHPIYLFKFITRTLNYSDKTKKFYDELSLNELMTCIDKELNDNRTLMSEIALSNQHTDMFSDANNETILDILEQESTKIYAEVNEIKAESTFSDASSLKDKMNTSNDELEIAQNKTKTR